MSQIGAIISLALTPITVIMCMLVVSLWWRSSVESLVKNNKTSTEWFIIGVVIGFLGNIIDNVYWGLAWSFEVFSNEHNVFFENGAWPNILFRQTMTSLAAYCHVRAVLEFNTQTLNKLFFASLVMGLMIIPLFFMVR